jgi:hypothetical protein
MKLTVLYLEAVEVDSVHAEITHSQLMMHLEDYHNVDVDPVDNEDNSKTAAALCIMGTGKMIRTKLKEETRPSCFQCCTPVEIKTTRMMQSISFEDVTLQGAVYARSVSQSEFWLPTDLEKHVDNASTTSQIDCRHA